VPLFECDRLPIQLVKAVVVVEDVELEFLVIDKTLGTSQINVLEKRSGEEKEFNIIEL
jgi:hypothetical protein